MLTENDAYNKLASLCAGVESCKADLEEKLKRWEIQADMRQRILNRLEKERFIDEERFANAFVRDKFRFSKWGKLKISQALYHKKISSEAIAQSLGLINDEEYLEVLNNVIASKRKNIKAKNDFEFNSKLIRFALSRGFEYVDIKQCIKDFDDEE